MEQGDRQIAEILAFVIVQWIYVHFAISHTLDVWADTDVLVANMPRPPAHRNSSNVSKTMRSSEMLGH